MTQGAVFIQSMIAVNVACPLAMSFGLGVVDGRWPRLALFWICVIVLFSLNQYIAHKLPTYRRWVWGMQGLNLLGTVLFGTVGAASGASILWFLINLGLQNAGLV